MLRTNEDRLQNPTLQTANVAWFPFDDRISTEKLKQPQARKQEPPVGNHARTRLSFLTTTKMA